MMKTVLVSPWVEARSCPCPTKSRTDFTLSQTMMSRRATTSTLKESSSLSNLLSCASSYWTTSRAASSFPSSGTRPAERWREMANATLTESATKRSVLSKRRSFRRQAAPHAATLADSRETAPSRAAINRLPASVWIKRQRFNESATVWLPWGGTAGGGGGTSRRMAPPKLERTSRLRLVWWTLSWTEVTCQVQYVPKNVQFTPKILREFRAEHYTLELRRSSFLVGLSWTRSEATNCLIPSLRWSYLWTCRHRWTRANSAYSFAHGHQICSSVHQKFLSLLRRMFRVNSSDPPFQTYVPSCTDAPRRCVVERSLQSGRVPVQKQVCGLSSCCMQLKQHVLMIYMSCHLSRPTSFSQRLQQLSHRFVVCVFTSSWRRIVEESRSRRDSSMTLHRVFVHCLSCAALRRSWALGCLKDSSCCRLIDSRVVFQSAISPVRQDMFMFSLSKGSAVNCHPVLLLFFCLLSLCFVMLRWTSSSCAWEVITSASHIGPHLGESWTSWRLGATHQWLQIKYVATRLRFL